MKITCPVCKRRIRLRRGQTIKCKCGNSLNYRRFFNEKIGYVVYLLDANILIYAANHKDPRHRYCQQLINFNSDAIKIGITERVKKELISINNRIPNHIVIYKTGQINEDILDLKTNYLKQPSETDLSLIQAARLHPEVRGIITYDKDFGRIATKGIIEKRSSIKFWLGDAKEFLGKYEIKNKIGS